MEMYIDLLKMVGQVLGIGGLVLGVCTLLFKEVLRKLVFPTFEKDNAYKILRSITVLMLSIGCVGIAVWTWGNASAFTRTNPTVTTSGPESPVVQGNKGDVRINFGKGIVRSEDYRPPK
jgi:hypothetical protein